MLSSTKSSSRSREARPCATHQTSWQLQSPLTLAPHSFIQTELRRSSTSEFVALNRLEISLLSLVASHFLENCFAPDWIPTCSCIAIPLVSGT
jgi:hypothetical protein